MNSYLKVLFGMIIVAGFIIIIVWAYAKSRNKPKEVKFIRPGNTGL